jgi:hypothetical protein
MVCLKAGLIGCGTGPLAGEIGHERFKAPQAKSAYFLGISNLVSCVGNVVCAMTLESPIVQTAGMWRTDLVIITN